MIMHKEDVAQEEAQTVPAPLPIPYAADEVSRIFMELLASFDFEEELYFLGIGRLHFSKRLKAKRNLMAICVALWHVALEKSFPNDADKFFAHFMNAWKPITLDRTPAKRLRELVVQYDTLTGAKKDADFTAVADCLIANLRLSEPDPRKLQLRISLRIRTIFELIFRKLI